MNNSQTVTIRFAKTSDAEQIAICHVASWQKIYRGHVPDAVLDALSVKEREQKWGDLLNNNVKILVLEYDNHIIGFVSLCPSRDKDTNQKKCAEISAIYLHPDFWHQGLGKELCKAALSELEMMGFSEVIVWVLKENEQARKFYTTMGFTETGHTKLEPYTTDVILNEVRYQKKLIHQFSFKPLQEIDLNLLCYWFNEPHVKEWWDDKLTNEEIKSKYKKRIGDSVVVPFICLLNDKPIGFIQYYQADKVGDGWWPGEVEGTIGIDQFIGEKNLINRGIGTKMLRAFIDHLFRNPHFKKIITDVDPKNMRAIRCYEKVGFEFVKEIMTPDGFAYLMVMDKNKLLNPDHLQKTIRFEKATLHHQDIIFSWLSEPHIQEFWDNSQEHKDDILNFIHGRKQHYFSGTTQYWVGYLDDQPFCFVLSDQILKDQDDLSDLHREHLSKNGHTISLDFGIGNKAFLGKGLAAPTLKVFTEFFKNKIDSNADTFFIDPNTNNPHAFHIYEKAGFQMVGFYHAKQGFFKEEKSYLMVKIFTEKT